MCFGSVSRKEFSPILQDLHKLQCGSITLRGPEGSLSGTKHRCELVFSSMERKSFKETFNWERYLIEFNKHLCEQQQPSALVVGGTVTFPEMLKALKPCF